MRWLFFVAFAAWPKTMKKALSVLGTGPASVCYRSCCLDQKSLNAVRYVETSFRKNRRSSAYLEPAAGFSIMNPSSILHFIFAPENFL
jgi:hypothetical protein